MNLRQLGKIPSIWMLMCIVLYTLQKIVILSQSKIQTQIAVNVYLNQAFQFHTSIQHCILKSEHVNHAFSSFCAQRLHIKCVLILCNALKSRGCLQSWFESCFDISSGVILMIYVHILKEVLEGISLSSCALAFLWYWFISEKRLTSTQDIGTSECCLIFFFIHISCWGKHTKAWESILLQNVLWKYHGIIW